MTSGSIRAIPPEIRLAQDCDDGGEVLDIAAFKSVLAQRDAHATQFRRLKDRLLGREEAGPTRDRPMTSPSTG